MASLESLFAVEPEDRPFSLLTVCTGNICRSPLAESLLRKVLRGLPLSVHSAGTRALVGAHMTEENRIIAAELGVDDAGAHRSRQLTREHVKDSSLILALSREHRTAVVELYPRASRYTFTLREFARLAEAIDLDELPPHPASGEQQLRAVVELAAQMRGTILPPQDPADDDVVDPYKQSDEVYVQSAKQITPAVNAIGTLFRNAARRGTSA